MRTRLDSLTGLRFVAALAVFGYHCGKDANPSTVRDIAVDIAGRGFVGVSFFYVLSGFVLTWSHREDDSPAHFFRRRFARIAPIYWVCLFGAWALVAVGSGDPARDSLRALPSVPALQAWFPDPAVHFAGNGPGWSISAEMFFYAMFPLLIVAAASRRGRFALALLAAALVLVLPAVLHPDSITDDQTAIWAIYVFPVTRLGEFVVGILLAKAIASGWRPPLGLGAALLLAAAAYAATGWLPAWLSVAIVTLVPFTLVLAAAVTADLEKRPSIWRSHTAVRLGEWSFAFYLVQWPVLRVQHKLVQVLDASVAVEWLSLLLALVVAVAASALLYTVVEKPLEKRLRGAPPRPAMLAAE